MAELGPVPHRSGDIADELKREVTKLGPTRNQLIGKGMVWSPNHADTSEVLKDIGLTTADAGGKLTFYGRDPILPSPIRFGTLAAVGLAARSFAVAALWRQATGEFSELPYEIHLIFFKSFSTALN